MDRSVVLTANCWQLFYWAVSYCICSLSTTGIALLYLQLHRVTQEASHLHRALDYVKRSMRILNGRKVTFLCGDAGPLAVGAVVNHKLNNSADSKDCLSRWAFSCCVSAALSPQPTAYCTQVNTYRIICDQSQWRTASQCGCCVSVEPSVSDISVCFPSGSSSCSGQCWVPTRRCQMSCCTAGPATFMLCSTLTKRLQLTRWMRASLYRWEKDLHAFSFLQPVKLLSAAFHF